MSRVLSVIQRAGWDAAGGTALHREAWRVYAQALIDGESVRRSAAKAGVHRNKAFRWRHRFLAAPAAMQAKRLAGIAEADETVMRRSYSGVMVY